MTREEAYDIKFVVKQSLHEAKMKLINKIYDYFESRTCESCKYNKEVDGFMVFCDNQVCKDLSKMMWHPYGIDYSCKYWESKDA